ncbi:MAG: VCBS repeat-containing protein [Acidobacteria bacterium]|nr:VCBS repeat-containing protein [Acidobacteriota bacterium]
MKRAPILFATLLVGACLTVLLSTLMQSPARAQKQPEPEQPFVARISVRSDEELKRLVGLGLDLLEQREDDDLFALLTRAEYEKLSSAGWRVEIDESRTQLLREQSADSFMGGYRTVPEMRSFVDELAARYPNLAEVVTYGSSWEKIHSGGTAGHDLFAVRLTNRQINGPKPTILINASIHPRELVTSELALRLIEYLLNNYGADGDATWLLDEHLIVIVPVSNPDGRRLAEQGLFQRKNTNTTYGGGCSTPPTTTNQYGVDLNRNFTFKWGTVNTPSEPRCGETYPGPSAASEPETAALIALESSLFADQRGPLDTDPAPPNTTGVFVDIHANAGLVMWPWAHTSTVPPNGPELQMMGTKLASYNGLMPVQAIELYPSSGGSRDHAYGELGIASFTFEIGTSSGLCGGFMPALSCLDGGTNGSFWPRNLPAFLYAAKLARTPYLLAQGPTPEALAAWAAWPVPNLFALRAQFDEQRNGGQNITAAEYYVGTPPWRGGTPQPMTALDGSFDSPTEVAVAVAGPVQSSQLIYVRARDANNNWGPVRAVLPPRGMRPNLTDFDGDGRTEVAVYRPADGAWYIQQSTNNGFRAQAWGTSTDKLANGDYDGDGKADIAVYRPSTGYWYILQSQTGTLRAVLWGVSEDLPAPGDYDADGAVDICVFRPSTGTWYVLESSNGALLSAQFGASTDQPVAGDYDRDGRTDFAVYRPGSSAQWFVLQSSDNSFKAQSFGISGDRAVPGDYDGDGKTDLAVFRPNGGGWYIQQSSNNFFRAQAWGTSADAPAPGDYDGDGSMDLAVFRPATGTWYILRSASGSLLAQPFGASGDLPVPSAYVP